MQGRYCDKKPNQVDWLEHPIWLNEDGSPVDPCPLGMAEIEDGSACVKKYFEPEQENPTCQAGLVGDVLNAPKCRKECVSGYFPIFDFCYGICPTELKQCGALCVEQDFICTDEQLEMST